MALGGGGREGAAIVPHTLSRARRPRSPGTGAPRHHPLCSSPEAGSSEPDGRVSFVTVSSPSEPARRRPCARGCKWCPLASAPPAALGARGRLGGAAPGPHPAATAAARGPRRLRPRLDQQRGSRASPGAALTPSREYLREYR